MNKFFRKIREFMLSVMSKLAERRKMAMLEKVIEKWTSNEFLGRQDELEKMVWERTAQLECKNKELEEKQAFIVQQEKMASIGQLAAGVAHEINNPIAYVYSNINTLSEYIGEIQGCYRNAMKLFMIAEGSSDEKVR